MTDPVFLIDKEAGPTSHDVVDRLRRALRMRRIGHTGTLDPFATGLLVCPTGRATRLSAYIGELAKEYSGRVKLGQATDTLDSTGTVIEQVRPADDWPQRLPAVLERFRGTIEQTPPMTSAIRIGGRRLYELARRGLEVDRPARRVTVHRLVAAEIDDDGFSITVACSKGTYVRTLAADIGRALGTCAHLTALRRTRIGTLRVEDALPAADIETVTRQQLLAAALTPSQALESWPAVALAAEVVARVRQGVAPPVGVAEQRSAGERVRLVDEDGALVALAEVSAPVGAGPAPTAGASDDAAERDAAERDAAERDAAERDAAERDAAESAAPDGADPSAPRTYRLLRVLSVAEGAVS